MGARTLRLPIITDIKHKGMHFIIMDSPSKTNVPYFVEECSKLNVSDVVRVCEDRYPVEPFENAGICVHHWEFSDGSPPPENILTEWFTLLRNRFYGENNSTHDDQNHLVPGPIAVHCIAGYGRHLISFLPTCHSGQILLQQPREYLCNRMSVARFMQTVGNTSSTNNI
ncbi:unnamed protein product [Schistosoma curassoni]|uniref:TYR_PHOSPHATASE_2 domain-containing protein n=1 Tax=Schistosoma curassoni TaxID=6186 RepID=A0A183KBD9_9TREM|nr:unnamed protein product [Schistosoma curassoni]